MGAKWCKDGGCCSCLGLQVDFDDDAEELDVEEDIEMQTWLPASNRAI